MRGDLLKELPASFRWQKKAKGVAMKLLELQITD